MVMTIRMHRLFDASPVPTPSGESKGRSEGQIPRSTESLTHDLNSTGSRSCCAICRDYILEGHSPNTSIHFVRGETNVFVKDQTLEWWACRQVDESDGEVESMSYLEKLVGASPASP